MNQKQLQYFVTVYQTQNIKTAADTPLRERLERYFGHSITTARKLCLQSWRHLRHSSL